MESLLDYDMCEINDNKFQEIKDERKRIEQAIEPSSLDYFVGDTSLRYEWIKSIVDKEEKIQEMIKMIKEENILPDGFPDEVYDYYAREALGLQYTKYEIKDIRRKLKIARNRELKKKKKN